jgi:hypothetical protein
MWEPLPLIVYGHAVHPLTPSRRDTRYSNRTNPRLSVLTEVSTEEHFINRDIVSLEVGDEIYAFEKYVPRGKETDGVWYRGYVHRRPFRMQAISLLTCVVQVRCVHKPPAERDLGAVGRVDSE